MPTVLRRYRFKLHPTAAQEEVLRHQARLLAQLWNGMLELCNNTYWCRREAARLAPENGYGNALYAFRHTEPEWHKPSRPWSTDRKTKQKALREKKGEAQRKDEPRPASNASKEGAIKGLTYQALTGEITAVRQACPEYAAISVCSQHRVAFSLARSFKAAFDRLRKGAKPGFPEFKPTRDATAVPLGSQSGWSLSSVGRERSRGGGKRTSARRWKTYVLGVPGLINARGEFPSQPKSWKTADINFSAGSWWLSVCIEIERERPAGDDAAMVHLNLIDEFARVERAMGPRRAREAQVSQSEEGSRPPSQNPYPLNTLAIGSANSQAGADSGLRSMHAYTDMLCPNSQTDADGGPPYRTSGELLMSPSSQTGAESGHHDQPHIPSAAGPNSQTDAESGNHGLIPTSPVRASNSRKGPKEERTQWSTRCTLIGERIDQLKSERDRRYPRRPGRKTSCRSRALSARISRLTARQARIRCEAQHRWSSALIATARDLTVFAPAIQKHTKSPRGDEKNWGAAIKDVTALNRHILNYAPAAAVEMLRYKAEEAGIRCDIIVDEAPAIAIGAEIVGTGKHLRRAKRQLKKEIENVRA